MSEHKIRFIVTPPGGRLDLCLVAFSPDLSRTRWQQLIRAGHVVVDGEIISKTGFQLQGGETIDAHVPPPKDTALVAEPIPLDILFENGDLLIVNKPAGMVVHPSVGHDSGTLVHAVLAHAPDIKGIGGEIRPGVVHRLDKDTSGLIIMAKNDTAHHALQRQFKDRHVDKVYIALVDGHPPTPVGRIEAPIGRDPRDRKRMAVVPVGRGREATSIFKTLEHFPNHNLLEVQLRTGRTHQIRVHLSFIGCPIVGDRVYGKKRPSLPIKRQFLHAVRLAITLPGEDAPRHFEAPLPDELEFVLDQLRIV